MNRHSFDAAYVERLCGADPETERHFFSYFAQLIRIKVRARRGSYSLGEDVVQETLARVIRTLRSPEQLRDPGSLGSFVNSVCNNVLLEFGRSQSRHRMVGEEPAPVPDATTPSPEARLIDEERVRAVRRIIDELPPKERRLLCALFLEERERTEVCRELGVDRDYLRVLVHRAKNQFRALYVEQERVAREARRSGGVSRPGARPRSAEL